MGEPFNNIMQRVDLPEDIKEVEGSYCIAEELIGGRQCTLEGYVYQGKVEIHGVVDSIRHRNRSTFFRYEYPSNLPKSVQNRMYEVSQKVLHHIGFDNSAFNIEFFWNKSRDKIWLLEINTRVSQSHSDLFEKVDGISNHKITVDVGLGKDPEFPHRKGKFKCASKFYFLKWEDGIVARIPTREEIEVIEKDLGGVTIDIKVSEGIRLSDLNEQDSYSYKLAWLFIGGDSEKDLMRKYRESIQRLHFEFRPVEDALPVGVIPGINDHEHPRGLNDDVV
jgi:acetyl/propionyl-CoA carboxylase alpha subunit